MGHVYQCWLLSWEFDTITKDNGCQLVRYYDIMTCRRYYPSRFRNVKTYLKKSNLVREKYLYYTSIISSRKPILQCIISSGVSHYEY